MAVEVPAPPPAVPPLGPGEDDIRSPAHTSTVPAAAPPLGPGDDDPRSPARGEAGPTVPPLGPGDSVGENPDDGDEFIAPPPSGAGGAQGGPRHVARRPRTQAVPPVAAVDAEEE